MKLLRSPQIAQNWPLKLYHFYCSCSTVLRSWDVNPGVTSPRLSQHRRAPCNSSWQKLMSLQPFGYCAPAHLPAAPFAYHGWAKSYVWYPVRGAARDPNPPFASIDSNAGPCPTLAICPELVGALRAQKERPFTLNAAAIR